MDLWVELIPQQLGAERARKGKAHMGRAVCESHLSFPLLVAKCLIRGHLLAYSLKYQEYCQCSYW